MFTAIELFHIYKNNVHHKGKELYYFFEMEIIAATYLDEHDALVEYIEETQAELNNATDEEYRKTLLSMIDSCNEELKCIQRIKDTYLDSSEYGNKGYLITKIPNDFHDELKWFSGSVVLATQDLDEAVLALDFLNAHAFITGEIKINEKGVENETDQT